MIRASVLAAAVLVAAASDLHAQQTIQLRDLQDAARAADPRTSTPGLLQQQSDLRLQNLSAQRLPSVSVEGLFQAQSDAATSPFLTPTGEPAFTAPKVIYDAWLRVDQRLFDSTIDAQTRVEQAQRAEQQARVTTALFGLRQQVNDAFFAAAALEQRRGALRATIDDLQGRLLESQARANEGTSLAADAMSVEATLLQRQQDEAELTANRRAALAQLQRLTGLTIGDEDVLALPDLQALVAQVRQDATAIGRERPEFAEFERARDRLTQQQSLAAAQERPQVSAFGRVGYGLPGLNFVNERFDTYALAGLQLRWRAWTWGTAGREQAALAIQQRIVAADQAAFTTQVARAAEFDRAGIDRLAAALAADERIVSLREEVMRVAESRFREGVITSSEYLDRSSELLQARFARAGHQVELAQASARLLTTLGVEP